MIIGGLRKHRSCGHTVRGSLGMLLGLISAAAMPQGVLAQATGAPSAADSPATELQGVVEGPPPQATFNPVQPLDSSAPPQETFAPVQPLDSSAPPQETFAPVQPLDSSAPPPRETFEPVPPVDTSGQPGDP